MKIHSKNQRNILFRKKIHIHYYYIYKETFDGILGSAWFSNKNSTILRPYFNGDITYLIKSTKLLYWRFSLLHKVGSPHEYSFCLQYDQGHQQLKYI